MIEKILGILATFTIGVISSGGYLGIALLMAIESACIPLPSEIIMPFAGYLVSTGHFNLYLAATAGAIACAWPSRSTCTTQGTIEPLADCQTSAAERPPARANDPKAM